MSIRIFIADDHGVLRAGLRALLRDEADLEVVGEAVDGIDALKAVPEAAPDVLLADISMPGATGIEVARDLHQTAPDVKVLILTMHEDGGLLQEALRVGARGYIVKRAVETELIGAIRTVAGGGVYVHRDMQWAMPALPLPHPPKIAIGLDSLQSEELAALRLIARGYTSHQIAAKLGIDGQGAEDMRARLGSKLGLRTRVEMIRYARDHGLLDN